MNYREDSPPIGGAYDTSVTAHYQCLNTLICIVYETGITAIWTLTREAEFNSIKSAAPNFHKRPGRGFYGSEGTGDRRKPSVNSVSAG